MKFFLFFFLCLQFSLAQNEAIENNGQILINENKLDKAIIYYSKQLKKATNDEQKIQMLFGLAEAYKLQLDYNTSNQYYLDAYKIIKNTNNRQLEFLYHVKMAEFYRKRTLHIEAAAQLDKANDIFKKNKIKDFYLAKYYNRKAALFTEHFHNNDSTLLYATKSLDLAKKLNDKDNIFYSQLEIAGVYERKKDYETSIKYLEEIIQFAKSNNLQQQEADAYISYIMALARSNQLQKALNAALYAANFSKKNKLFYNEIIFNENIQNLYFRMNNTEKAYEYLKNRLELTTKYNEIKKEELVLNLEAKYKLKEKENEIKINRLEIINKDKELVSNKAKLYVIIGLFLIAVLITLLVGYFYTKSNKSNKKLKILSKQNEFLVSETNHRVNNNLQLIAVLIENKIRKNKNDNEKSEFKRLLTKVEAIASLHRHLYVANNTNKINLQKYIADIKNNFEELILEENIQLNVVIDAVQIHSDNALFLGLLITELLINSMKHAFDINQEKSIQLSIKFINNQLDFNYKDNGKNSKHKVLKPLLVEQLCMQLEVQHTIDTENGFQFNFKKSI